MDNMQLLDGETTSFVVSYIPKADKEWNAPLYNTNVCSEFMNNNHYY